ncbi:hypothetical protein AB0937_38390 [Streptomyces sp. NPDC047880]|uniref:hypothetical protein n=1 Tax=Streptomyces TaxID=1883 RepID=UPI0013C1A000|nr:MULTISPECIES: hypothetical protein [Streptomyces]NEB62007.1 hypothetical protein [Streptomyces diastaticus]NEC30028.1 hypothetical protein [Streptomyces sp. SID8111]WUB58817.1 hypothetical protein OG942_44065 [Streptomyces griseorubiginosus]
MITTTITHSRVYGTVARLSDQHPWVKATLRQHGFEWSHSLKAFTAPGTRSWPFDHYRFARLTRELRRCGFPVKVVVDNAQPAADPIADALTELFDLAYAVQRLGAALAQDMLSRPGQVTPERIKEAQEAVEAAQTKAERIEARPGVYEQPEMTDVWHLLTRGATAVGLPPF